MIKKKLPLICVVGPTASGKSFFAVELAKRFHGEVISVDSMQIYKGMNIGTAKITEKEMQAIPHHLLDLIDPDEPFSVVDYVRQADQLAFDIVKRGKIPVIAGGTGLYFHSFIDHIQFARHETSKDIREKLKAEALKSGSKELYERLKKIDPETAERVHPNNIGRVIRALEVFELTGKTMSQNKELSKIDPTPYSACIIGLDFKNREVLYDRINNRVEEMFSAGFIEEVESLLKLGYRMQEMNAIGYSEVVEYLNGNISLNDCKLAIKIKTRHYAKRQLTWFRRDSRIHWLYPDDISLSECILQAEKIIKESRIF